MTRVEKATRTQRGATVLIVTMALFFASLLATLYVNRNLIFEQRSSADQYRSTQAFEAAEAGVEWALALLNDVRRVGNDCLPTAAAAATSFRTGYVGAPDALSTFHPAVWNQNGASKPLQPTCVLGKGTWTCGCPTAGLPSLAAPTDIDPAPAFILSFGGSSAPGIVQLKSTGCTSLAGACVPNASTTVDATADVSINISYLPGLRSAPAAPLTARGAVDAGAASIGLSNADPATALVLQAGGHISAAAARLSGPAGGSTGNLMLGDDATLSALSTDQFFTSYFGLTKTAWKGQPSVQRVHCAGDCGASLLAAVAAAADGASIWADGDIAIGGPLTLGTLQQPIVIVVDGAAKLTGAVTVNGVLYASSIQWDAADSNASIHGSAISEGSYSGNGAPDIVYDAGVLTILRKRPSSYARVTGSWHDQ